MSRTGFPYEDGLLYVCPECGSEWPIKGETQLDNSDGDDDVRNVQDSNGTALADGDSITVIKDLKIKGTSSVVKVGTKAKNIRLVSGDHNIDCKIDGIGAMKLKSEFVRKA
jgi:protein PhnA